MLELRARCKSRCKEPAQHVKHDGIAEHKNENAHVMGNALIIELRGEQAEDREIRSTKKQRCNQKCSKNRPYASHITPLYRQPGDGTRRATRLFGPKRPLYGTASAYSFG